VIGGDIVIPTNRQIHAKLEIIRPSGRVDVTPYLEAAEVELGSIEDLGTGTGADIGVRTLTFSLRNDGQHVQYWDTDTLLGDSEKVLGDTEDGVDLTAIIGAGKWARRSFAPRDKQSDWNVVAGEWEPLLWPYRGVVFQVAVTAPGMAPNNWITLFEGYLGDNITTEPHRVTVHCRDKSKRLQDAYIDTPKTYTGPMAAETLIQAIINDYVENPPQLYCPVPSGITFDEMKVEYVSVWDAIQNVAKQMGWFLGYRWNGTSYALTFIEPPRSKDVADFHFDWEDDFYQESLDIGDADIRNALTLSYRDKETGERVTLSYRDFPQLKNQESIDEYGKRAMQIEEADTSLIDTQEKALAFGEKCIWDLSELNATDRLVLPFFPWLDIFSTFTVTNPLISSTTDFYAVQNIRHSLRFGEDARFRTEVIATTRVVGAKRKWLDMETRPGSPGDPKKQGPPGPPGKDGYTPPIPADPVWGNYRLTKDGLLLTWKKAADATDYEIRSNLNWGDSDGILFRGYDHQAVIMPWDRQMTLYMRSLNSAGEYSDNYATLDVDLQAPPAPNPVTVEAFFSALKITVNPVSADGIIGYDLLITNTDTGDTETVPLSGAGTLTYPVESGIVYVIRARAKDILGYGAESSPVQAESLQLSSRDIPEEIIEPSNLVKSLREDIDLIKEIDQSLDAIIQTVGDNESGLVGQMALLADQWTVKLNADGNVAGVGLVFDDNNISEFAIVADKFSVATPTGKQNVFTVIDGKAYLVGDMIAEGSILAKHIEADEIKTLLLKAEAGFFDEADILKIDAQRIYVGDNIELGDNRVVVKGNPKQIINITEDTYTSGWGPTAEQNFSTSDVLMAGEYASETFMKIPLPSDIIAVEKATIWLYVRGVTLDTEWSSGSFEIAAVGSDWDYKTLTHNNKPSSRQRVIPLDSQIELLQPGKFIGIDITEIVKDWLSGSYPNYGVRLRFPSTLSILIMSSSRAAEAERPYLEISYLSESAPKETKVAIGNLQGLPWQGGVIPQGTYGLYTVDGYFQGDISGSSGEFADGKIRIGDISGKPWGNGTLPAGTKGIWGEKSGIFLRGYPRLILVSTGFDEDRIDLSSYTDLADPQILVIPKEITTNTTAEPGVVSIFVDAERDPTNPKIFTLKGKSVIRSSINSLGSRAMTTSSWELILPTTLTAGKRGVETDLFVVRPMWEIYYVGMPIFGYPPINEGARLWLDITNQFDSNGQPINWQNVNSATFTHYGEGVLNWDITLPSKGIWAMRIRGAGEYESYEDFLGNTIDVYARTGLNNAGYRANDKYLYANGNLITDPNPANVPSGMSLTYFVFDKG